MNCRAWVRICALGKTALPFLVRHALFGANLIMASSAPGYLFLSIWQIPPPLLFGCGTIVTLAMIVELSDIPAVTATEAVEMLGVSTARVAQLCRDGARTAGRSCRASAEG